MNQRRSIRLPLGQQNRRQIRLLLEPLEARRLLAGLNVSVFIDQNASRSYEPDVDLVASDRLVFLDSNRNGQFDADERLEFTDSEGNAFFDGLAEGDHTISLLSNTTSQHQITPVAAAPNAQLLSDVGGSNILTNTNLDSTWVVDLDGIATQIDGPEPDNTSVDLQGNLVASQRVSDETHLLIVESHDSQVAFNFNTVTGDLRELELTGLNADERIKQVAASDSGLYALIESNDSTRLAPLEMLSEHLRVGASIESDAHLIVASKSAGIIFAAEQVGQVTNIKSVDPSTGESAFEIELSGTVRSMALSRSAKQLFVEMSEGGVQAISVGPNALEIVAMLSEASGPLSAQHDGRLISASSLNTSEVVVWDTPRWTPASRTQLPEGTQVTRRSGLVTDRRGDQLRVVTDEGIHGINLAIGTPLHVRIHSADEIQTGIIGVEVNGENLPPQSSDAPRSLEEDGSDELDLRELNSLQDPDGDTLWFTLTDSPEHGMLNLSPSGHWLYEPDANYNGQDSATIRVHDGQVSTEVVVQIDVRPVNDLPLSITVQTPDVSEDTPAGSHIGFVSIVDVDRDASYRVTTSDPRFTVDNGRLLLSGGQLDYETEGTIVLEVLATDESEPSIVISTSATVSISDVNEAPVGIYVEQPTLQESTPGAQVGAVIVDDQDSNSVYEFTVSDPRFEVIDGILQLVDGEIVDFEEEETVEVILSAVDPSNSQHEVETTLTLTVVNQNDPPRSLSLSNVTVESGIPGSSVGHAVVDDPDAGQQYTFSVSDERFEFIGNALKLKLDHQISRETEPTVALTISAQAANGDQISNDLVLQVSEPTSPYQNPDRPNDVNGDGHITPLDVIVLINHLNSEGGGFEFGPDFGAAGEGDAAYPDVNGDGMLTPLDALLIINFLNGNRNRGSGEAEGESGIGTQQPYGPLLPSAGFPTEGDAIEYGGFEDLRKKHASNIDAELESLLDEMSRCRP